MKKIIILFFVYHFSALSLYAQKELWGVSRETLYADQQGNIVKFDMNGENAVTVHHFNFPTGKLPTGKLFLASNGKLYGTATFGGINGITNTNDQDGYGVLYEYNLTFETYRAVHYFNYISPTDFSINPTSSLIEPIPGKLYGGTKGGSFYVYDIATETVTTLNHNYSFIAMGGIYTDLIKASNGFIYAISRSSFPCTSSGPNQPNQGSLIKINTLNNTAQRVAVFGCSNATTINAFGGYSMIEVFPNKIFFITDSVAYVPSEESVLTVGGIIEYNTITNELTQKLLFDATNPLGYNPKSFIMGDNGNLYGVCEQGGETYRTPFTTGLESKTGTMFEYNPTTNSIVKLTEFLPFQNLPQTIIKLTTGELVGNLGNGSIFKYNINSNTLQFPDLATYSDFPNQFSTRNLIEICRKPSYQEFIPNTFTPCVNTPFSYNINNTNATNYVWKKNGVIVPLQTTGILNINNLIASDTGIYTCTMTNECGTTTTMNLNITVNCLDVPEVIADKNTISLYPNPTKNTISIYLPENGNYEVQDIYIVNLLSQTVIKNVKSNKNIDVSSLQKGIYIVNLKTNNGDWNGKFVKE